MSDRRRSLSLAGLGWIVLTAVAVAALVLVWRIAPQRTAVRQASEFDGTAVRLRRIVYRIDPKRFTTFRFTQPVRQARLVIQPELAGSMPSRATRFVYAVEAEMFDERGATVARRTVHLASILLPAEAGKGGNRVFREGSGAIGPFDDVRLATETPIAGLRLRLAEVGPGIVTAYARLAERRPMSAAAARTSFVRIQPAEQRRLAAGNAFPVALLEPEERANIAINNWYPVGPTGIEGRDYHSRVLYELDSAEPDEESAGEGGG